MQGRAVHVRRPGDSSALSLEEFELGEPGRGELLVRVAASGLNRADILQRKGSYPAPPGAPVDIPGLEYAGTVETIGAGVLSHRVGSRVMGIVAGGGMASHVIVHEREAMPVPADFSLTEAAAIPEVFLTAYDALFAIARLGVGQRVLIHAAGSGVGTAAIQLARCAGALVVGTSRSEHKLARCLELGMHHAIEVGFPPHFAEELERRTGAGADVILDTIGGSYLEENVRAIAPRGTIVCIGLLGGASGSLPLAALLHKRARIEGSVLRARPLEEKAALTQAFARTFLPSFERRELRPIVDRTFPIEDVARAHEAMERDDTFGKVVLTW